MYKDNDSIPQTFEFNKDGYPINPATGEAYHRDEIVTNETIPYPRHVDPQNPSQYWARRTPAQLQAEKSKAAKKSKARQCRRANRTRRTINHTATDYLSSAEIQTRERSRATVDLVERVNGEPESPANQLQFVVQDGPHYNPATGWTVIVDGDEAAWANSKTQAERSYHELVDDSDAILVTVGGRLSILEV